MWSCTSCSYRWMRMEGSLDSGWNRSDSSRGLNTSAVLDRNPNRTNLSGDASLESASMPPRRKNDGDFLAHTDHCKGLVRLSEDYEGVVDPLIRALGWGEISLRQWLDKPERIVDAFESLHIFRQIVEMVNLAHSQGIIVHNVRPSCFVMSSFNHVSFIESASCSDSGSDTPEDALGNQNADVKGLTPLSHDLPPRTISLVTEDNRSQPAPVKASRTVSDASMQFDPVHVACASLVQEKVTDGKIAEEADEQDQLFPMKQILLMEGTWYTSSEEASGTPSSRASDIYRLGVLLFELFCTFGSREEKIRTMSSLRHRVLPPQLLLKWPKEASFCLWLLHPDPSSRPTMGELLQSQFLNEPRESLGELDAAMELQEQIEEQELLLEFLLLLQQRKQDASDKLQDTISFISSDIDEVLRRNTLVKKEGTLVLEPGKDEDLSTDFSSVNASDNEGPPSLGSRKRFRSKVSIHKMEDYSLHQCQKLETKNETQENILCRNSRLVRNFKKLELAYFLTRCRPSKVSVKPVVGNSPICSSGRGSAVATERSSVNNVTTDEQYSASRQGAWIDPFLEGLCKYLSFSKLKVKAELKQGDLLSSSNLVCSLSFDRDGEFFATAGVNKKIKVFECDGILNEERDIHYPVVEMASGSKLSSTCWNSYIKSQIASSNFDGVVQVWDVTRSQVLTEMREHERRVWSIDFSSVDPTLLASASDDGSVKLWNINQGTSVSTIKTKANVCCVQFPLDSSRYLAFGSADHRIYYYDLRNSKMPLCTLFGHNKTVSYVKFIDSKNLVSASTDNTLKLWDLSMCTSRVLDNPLQSFSGHMNIKNFVGLSVSDGYIATGSETNEVFIYHKAFPMPMMSFKFNIMDPYSGRESDDAAQFISSVCWRGQSNTLVAANSTGNIKILEMVQ